MKAYHFVGEKLRDGTPIPPDGEWLEHYGEVEMCRRGLHASKHPSDALKYAPGNTLCLVEVEEVEAEQPDKVVARRRKILKRIDATEILHSYARWCALQVVHLWDAPDFVVEYLKTGRGDKRRVRTAAAANAASYAAYAAAYTAAANADAYAAYAAADAAAADAAAADAYAAYAAAANAAYTAAANADAYAAYAAAYAAYAAYADVAFKTKYRQEFQHRVDEAFK